MAKGITARLIDIVEFIISEDARLLIWVQLYDVDRHRSLKLHRDSKKIRGPVYYASLRGFEELVHRLLAKGSDTNASGKREGCPLQAAAHRGHVKLVKMLLQNAAEFNAQG